jgi:D-amino-acid dehydrogenase
MSPHHHIVILGGGVIGLSCAHYLRREGHGVTILEIGQAGRRCSLHNAGLVVPSHVIPLAAPGIIGRGLSWMLQSESPFYLKPRLSPSLLRWAWLFRRSASEETSGRAVIVLHHLFAAGSGLFEELAACDGMDFGLQRRGLLMLYRTEEGKTACEHDAAVVRRAGVRCELLDARSLGAREPRTPFRAEGGVFYPDDAHLLPSVFVEQLRSLVLREGVRIRENIRFLGWERGGSGVASVRTGEGAFRADTFVLAAGAWSGVLARRLGLRLPLEAGKGYSLTVPAPEWRGNVPMLLTEDRVAVTPLDGTLRFAGTMEIAGLDETIRLLRVRAIARAVPRYLDLPEPSLDGQLWSGLRPCSPDGLPYIGRFGEAPNLIAATGHAMLGLTLAPVTGRLVGDIVARRSPPLDLSAVRPDRFSSS